VLDSIDSSFGYWLAGFTDGEGAFMLLRTSDKSHPNWRAWTIPRFAIGLRADDHAVLELIRDTLGLGMVRHKPARGAYKPEASFVVWRIGECLQMVDGWVPTKRPELHHRADYGDPPLCLCGCEGRVKLHGGRGIPHPENQAYARYLRGHHMRTPQSRARIRLAFRGY
jgi:hypothetical protein